MIPAPNYPSLSLPIAQLVLTSQAASLFLNHSLLTVVGFLCLRFGISWVSPNLLMSLQRLPSPTTLPFLWLFLLHFPRTRSLATTGQFLFKSVVFPHGKNPPCAYHSSLLGLFFYPSTPFSSPCTVIRLSLIPPTLPIPVACHLSPSQNFGPLYFYLMLIYDR